MTKLYFAYGSALDPATWNGTMRMTPVGVATLPDNVLAFDYRSRRRRCGVLNLRERVGGIVEGYLLEVDDATVSALNKREGHPNFYVREDVMVLDPAGHEVRAFTCRVPSERTGDYVAPNEAYLASCLAGRDRFDLPFEDVETAAEGKETLCTAVFVYGTLMRGEGRASSWAHLRPPCVLLARGFGTLHHHGAYPGFVPARDDMVEGEFIRFDGVEAALERFDRIEGFLGFGKAGNLFRRTLVMVDVGGGRARQAWTYATTRIDAPVIQEGDWRKATGVRRAAMSSILAAHAAAGPDFFARLSNVPDGPFGTVCEPGADFGELLERLDVGDFDERGLCRASGTWSAGLEPA